MGKPSDPFLAKLKANREQRGNHAARDRIRKWTDPVLSQPCRPVTVGENVSGIAGEMLETLRAVGNGVGLGAPQIGHTVRIIVLAAPGTSPRVMVNPEVTVSGSLVSGSEGCLSYPGVNCAVLRYETVDAVWFDVTDVDQASPLSEQFTGYAARIVQHEVDHLNGVCKVGNYWRKTKHGLRHQRTVFGLAGRAWGAMPGVRP